MNNDIRFYIVTSEAIEKESVLEKMLTLICNNKASVTKYNNIYHFSPNMTKDTTNRCCLLSHMLKDDSLYNYEILNCPHYSNICAPAQAFLHKLLIFC